MSSNPQMYDLIIPVGPDDHAIGPDDAPVTLVEYGDYECPYCGRAFPILQRLRQTLPDKFRLVFRHFPQNNVHPHASVGAQAAESAGAQGKFWPMHDMLFEHQDELAGTDLIQYALRLGLEVYSFEADLSSERYAARIREDYQDGLRSGVKKTPTLFINRRRYSGALDYDTLLAEIKTVLETAHRSQ